MKKIILLLFLLGTLIGCHEKEETIAPRITSYPMSVGSEWTYERQIVVNKYESKTSHKIVDTDTYDFAVKVWVDKDTVINGKEVVKFIANSENVNLVNFHFMDQEGLKTYAYNNAGAHVFAQAGIHLKSAALDRLLAGDPLFYEQPPTMNLKFPLRTGARWTYRQPTEFRPLKIEKQVTGTETVHLAGEQFDCYKIEYLYSNDETFSNIKMTEWISGKGLVKRTIVHENITIQNETGEQLSFGHSIETLTLKAVAIK